MVKKGDLVNSEGMLALAGDEFVGIAMEDSEDGHVLVQLSGFSKVKGDAPYSIQSGVTSMTGPIYSGESPWVNSQDGSWYEPEPKAEKKKMRVEDFTPAKAGERYLDV